MLDLTRREMAGLVGSLLIPNIRVATVDLTEKPKEISKELPDFVSKKAAIVWILNEVLNNGLTKLDDAVLIVKDIEDNEIKLKGVNLEVIKCPDNPHHDNKLMFKSESGVITKDTMLKNYTFLFPEHKPVINVTYDFTHKYVAAGDSILLSYNLTY